MELTTEQAVALVEVREMLREGGFDVDSQSDEQVIGAACKVLALWQMAAQGEPQRNALLQMVQAWRGQASTN